jgi:NAD(P) transhydrogenase subunit alpha
MYSNNLYNLIDEFWNKDKKQFELRLDDEIIKNCLITHDGKIVHPTFAPRKTEKKFQKG